MKPVGEGRTSSVYLLEPESFVVKIRKRHQGSRNESGGTQTIRQETKYYCEEYGKIKKLAPGLFPNTLYYVTGTHDNAEMHIIQRRIKGIPLRDAVMLGFFDDYSNRKNLIRLLLQSVLVYLFSKGQLIPDIAGWPVVEFLNPLATQNAIFDPESGQILVVDTNMSRTCAKLPVVRFLSFSSCVLTTFLLLNPLFKPSYFVKDTKYYESHSLWRSVNGLLTCIADKLHGRF
ncbi:MAG: hypothetical protein N3A71_03670 [Candidatus Dojkabacteria bacterium]|nr:hypothetical protein [Candidatus Dojkabacteria bacterium]